MPISLRSVSFASLRQHRWFRPAVRALAGLIALWLITWLAIPPLVKGPLERIASEQLGRTVTVGGIDFEPWSLEFALRDVTVAGANGAPPQLTIGRIYADGELQSLLRLAPVVDAFTIENPVLRITHLGDGRYDVDDIIAKVTAPKSEPEPDTGPARLALYNLALTGGSIDFIDNTVSETHEVRALALKVPFISTLPSQREVKVEPHLAFTLDGSRFDSSAEGTPFAQTGKADAQIRLDGLNLAPYLGYLPANLPVKVLGATLDADVKVAFEQHPRMAVKLTGTVQASGVRMADRQGADLLSYERLKIDMADVRPLDQVVRLQHVELTAPVVTATRDASGQINLAQLATPTPPAQPSTPAKGKPATPATSASADTAASPPASAASAPASPASTGKAKAKAAAPPGRWKSPPQPCAGHPALGRRHHAPRCRPAGHRHHAGCGRRRPALCQGQRQALQLQRRAQPAGQHTQLHRRSHGPEGPGQRHPERPGPATGRALPGPGAGAHGDRPAQWRCGCGVASARATGRAGGRHRRHPQGRPPGAGAARRQAGQDHLGQPG